MAPPLVGASFFTWQSHTSLWDKAAVSYSKPETEEERKAVAALLDRAHQLLLHPDRWCRGDYARDTCGQQVSSKSKEAVSFCVVGALECEARSSAEQTGAIAMLYEVLPTQYSGGIRELSALTEWNDGVAEHEEVLSLLRRAKELLNVQP